MSTSRILPIVGLPHPKVLVQSVDVVAGSCTYAWLNSNDEQVDSGGSVARFTPVMGLVDGVEVPADPGDAALIAAIEAPVVVTVPPWRVLKDTLWMRFKAAGKQAEAVAFITSLPTSQRLDWDSQSWFWSDNAAIRAVCVEMGVDPDVALARDPLAP